MNSNEAREILVKILDRTNMSVQLYGMIMQAATDWVAASRNEAASIAGKPLMTMMEQTGSVAAYNPAKKPVPPVFGEVEAAINRSKPSPNYPSGRDDRMTTPEYI